MPTDLPVLAFMPPALLLWLLLHLALPILAYDSMSLPLSALYINTSAPLTSLTYTCWLMTHRPQFFELTCLFTYPWCYTLVWSLANWPFWPVLFHQLLFQLPCIWPYLSSFGVILPTYIPPGWAFCPNSVPLASLDHALSCYDIRILDSMTPMQSFTGTKPS